jgi:ABC-type branched-subunit amino acid transport system substrate-binding protein
VGDVSDSVVTYINALASIRTDCANTDPTVMSTLGFFVNSTLLNARALTGQISLVNYTSTVSFSGATSSVTFSQTSNNRYFNGYFDIVNFDGSKFVRVGSIVSGVVSILTVPGILYPGSMTTPPRSFRLGILATSSATSSSYAQVVNSVKLAVQQMNSVGTFANSFFANTASRDHVEILWQHIQYDDCGVVVGVTEQAIDNLMNTITNIKPMAVVGPGCPLAMSRSAVITRMNTYAVPMVSYGVDSDFLSDALAYPYFLRVNLAARSEIQFVLAAAQTMGWARVACFYSNDTFGAASFASMQALSMTYNIKLVYSESLGASSNVTQAMISLQAASVNVVLLMCSDLDNSHSYTLPVLQAAVNLGLTKGYQWIATSQIASLLTSTANPAAVTLGMQFSVPSFDASNPNFLAFKALYTAAYGSTPQLAATFAYDAALKIGQAVGSLLDQSALSGSTSTASLYVGGTMMYAMKTVTPLANGTTGLIQYQPFASNNNNRIGQAGAFVLYSQKSSTAPVSSTSISDTAMFDQNLGLSNTAGDFVYSVRPTVWGGKAVVTAQTTFFPAAISANNLPIAVGASIPIPSCSRGTVGFVAAPPLVRILCLPCAQGQIAPASATSCQPCTSTRSGTPLCLYGGSVGFAPADQAIIYAGMVNRRPYAAGDYAPAAVAVLTTTFTVLASVVGGGIFMTMCAHFVFSFVSKDLNQQITQILVKFDMFTRDHPSDLGKPILNRATALGGYATLAFVMFGVVGSAYMYFSYQFDMWSVRETNNIGLSLYTNPYPLLVTVSFISVDDFVNCPNLCSLTKTTGITGVICAASLNTTLATCTVSLTVPTGVIVPFAFTYDINYVAAHTASIFYQVQGSVRYAVSQGINNTLIAPDNTVFYGTQPLVVNMALQPFVFSPDPTMSTTEVPVQGYIFQQQSLTIGSFSNASYGYNNLELSKIGAGTRVQLVFSLRNSVSQYSVSLKRDLIDLGNSIAAGILVMLMFVIKGILMALEGFVKSRITQRRQEQKSFEQKEFEAREERRRNEEKDNFEAETERLAHELGEIKHANKYQRREAELRAKSNEGKVLSIFFI